MAITSVGSWLPVIDEVIAHWMAVNAFLAPGQLILSSNTTLGVLQTKRADLAAQLAEVQAKLNSRTIASSDRDIKRMAMRAHLQQFKAAARGQLPRSRYLVSLPVLPQLGAAPGSWRTVMDEVANLWAAINANTPAVPGFTPPLVLGGPYPLATFLAERAALEAAFSAVATTEQNLQQAREMRDEAFEWIYQKLLEYRLAVIGGLPAGHALLASIPRITPPRRSAPDAP